MYSTRKRVYDYEDTYPQAVYKHDAENPQFVQNVTNTTIIINGY